jgi:hypothetical protein
MLNHSKDSLSDSWSQLNKQAYAEFNSREQLKPPKLHRSGENSFKQLYQLAKKAQE